MGDMADRAEQESAFLLEKSLANRKLTQGIAQRMDQVVFCQDCGEMIPKARIKAMPYCQCCTACQTKREKGVRR